MNFLQKISIKNKLLINTVIPLLALSIISILIIVEHLERQIKYSDFDTIVQLDAKISLLVHETQKERGVTAGYLGSKGLKFTQKLPSQKLDTDSKIKELQMYIEESDVVELLLSDTKQSLDNVLKKLSNIKNIRTKVSSQTISAKDAIAYYTKMNQQFLNFIAQTSKQAADDKLTYSTISYYNFLQSKERAGIERAIGSATFANDKFSKGAKTRLESLISEQNSYMDSFETLASDELISFKNQSLQGKSVDEVNRMRKILSDSKEIGGFGVDTDYWFDTISKKINLLKKVENYIAENLTSNSTKAKDAIDVSKAIANLLHETQKERGATAGFIGSKGKNFTKKLALQRIQTNKKISMLKLRLSRFNYVLYPQNIKQNIKLSLNNISKIQDIRNRVNSLNIKAKDAISYYTNMNGTFLNNTFHTGKYFPNAASRHNNPKNNNILLITVFLQNSP